MKRAISVLLLLALTLGLCACGGSAAELDGEALLKELLGSDAFSQTLDELPAGKAEVFYSVPADKLSGALMYHAPGVSKEQAAVFTAVDEAAAREIVSILQGLLEEWIESDRSYAPAEVPKMEKAVLRQSGDKVILVVANAPDTASHIVDKYL